MRSFILLGAVCALGSACSFIVSGCSEDATTADAADGGTKDSGTDVTPSDAGSDAPQEASVASCIENSGADAFFAVADTTKCVVGVYTVAVPALAALTWGRHGGPVGFDGKRLVRYAVPATSKGTLTATSTAVTVPNVPGGVFWGSQALDLPFFPTLKWTAIAYTGSGAAAPGEIVIVDDTGVVAKRYNVNGFFAETAIATSGGRLLYTGLSPLATAASATNAGGLYAADTCGTAASNPRLLPESDGTCGAPLKVSTWQAGASGPVTVDAAGNAFAILSTFGGNQEMRGFEHDTIARGATATAGTTMFTIPGYTSELAADGKAAYFQPNDSSTYAALDVQRVLYTVDANAKMVSPNGAPATFLTMTKAGTPVALLTDDKGYLWVGVSNPGADDAGPISSTFFVLADKP
jgi:hypothetical protein